MIAWTAWATAVSTREVSADLRAYDAWSRSAVLEHAVREAAVQAGEALAVVLLALTLVVLLRSGSRRGRPPQRNTGAALGRTT